MSKYTYDAEGMIPANVNDVIDSAQPPKRVAEVGRTQVNVEEEVRFAPSPDTVALYLPSNYEVTEVTDEKIVISGRDHFGWTLDGYVIPRLASGLIFAKEVTP